MAAPGPYGCCTAGAPSNKPPNLPAQLGCALDERNRLLVDSLNQTAVPGVYAAGDNCSPMHQLAHAIGTGNRVGAELSRRLILSRTLPTHPYPLPRMLTDDALLTLRRHAVRLTALRQSILGALLQSPFALSRTESEPHLTLDRVTVYRTLRTFEEKGIVHRIIDHSETVRYAAAYPDAPAPAPANDHVHFKCTAC